jgi:hypothetical protein
MVNFLLGMDTPPQVLTTSYGYDETGLDVSLATNLCNAYMQLGARGTSIVRPQSSLWGLDVDTLFSSLLRVMEVSPEFMLSRALPSCESIFCPEYMVTS